MDREDDYQHDVQDYEENYVEDEEPYGQDEAYNENMGMEESAYDAEEHFSREGYSRMVTEEKMRGNASVKSSCFC